MDPSEEPTIQYTLSSRCEDFLNDTQAAVRANARLEDIPLTASIATVSAYLVTASHSVGSEPP